jgi:branched-chain amino acid transport system substrate-binding protein
MEKRSWKEILFGVTFLLAFSASGVLAESGVSDKEILVGGSLDLTGPAAFMGQGVHRGIKLYFSKVNAEGGIHGSKVTFVAEDDGYVVAKTVANYKKLTMKDNVFCMLGSSGSVGPKALIPYLAEDKVPMLGPYGYTSAMFRPPVRYLFNIYSTCEDQARILMDFVKANLKMDKPKIGLLAEDNEIGEDTIRGAKAQMAKYGWGEPEIELYKRSAIDFSSQVLRLKGKNVDVLFFPVIVSHGVSILKECQKIDFTPYLFGAPTMTDIKFLEMAGESAFYGKGFRAFATQVGEKSDAAGAKEFQQALAKYDPENKIPNSFNLFGYGIAKVLCEGIQRAGKDLTREKLVEALEALKGYETGIFPPVTYGKENRRGTDAARILKVDKEKNDFVIETTWLNAK